MGDALNFFGQKREAARVADLTAHIGHSDPPDQVLFFLAQEFYPPWRLVKDEEGCSCPDPHRTLRLDAEVFVPCDGHWRNVAHQHIQHQQEIVSFGEVVQRAMSPPEFTLDSYGHGPWHTHLEHSWECSMTFGAQDTRDPFSLPFTLRALCPSDRAREIYRHWSTQEIQSWFDLAPKPPPEDEVEGIAEGGWFHYEGHGRLIEVHCTVPENTSDPIRYAKALAGKRLGLQPADFGFCRVNGGHRYLETWEPHHGLLPIGGRLVILETIDDRYRRSGESLRQGARLLEEYNRKNPPPPNGGP